MKEIYHVGSAKFFFVSDTIFMHLHTSFSRCFSSLGVLLLSSMSLRISTSFLKSLQSLLLLLSRLLHRLLLSRS